MLLPTARLFEVVASSLLLLWRLRETSSTTTEGYINDDLKFSADFKNILVTFKINCSTRMTSRGCHKVIQRNH